MWGAKPKKNISMKGKKTQWGVIHKKYQEGGGGLYKKKVRWRTRSSEAFQKHKSSANNPKGSIEHKTYIKHICILYLYMYTYISYLGAFPFLFFF